MRPLKTGLHHSLTYGNPLALTVPKLFHHMQQTHPHIQKQVNGSGSLQVHTHTNTWTSSCSLTCTYDSCTLTRARFWLFSFLSSRERIHAFASAASGTTSCGTEEGKKNKKGKKLRATPSKMSFTAALPQKSHVSLKWRALEKTLQAPKQTHSRLTTALQRSWQSACRNSGFVCAPLALLPTPPLATFLTWSEERREEPSSPVGRPSHTSHWRRRVALRQQTITSPASYNVNKRGGINIHMARGWESSQWMDGPHEGERLVPAEYQRPNTAQVMIFRLT